MRTTTFPPAPTGPARIFYVAGLLVFFVGFAVFAFAIVSTIAEVFQTLDSATPYTRPPSFARLGQLVLPAFALMLPGSLVTWLASALGPHPAHSNTTITQNYGGNNTFAVGGGSVRQTNPQFRNTQHTIVYTTRDAVGDLDAIRRVVLAMQLDPRARRAIDDELLDAQRQIGQGRFDPNQVGDRLARATDLLRRTGALAEAGLALAPPLQRLASLLGAAGDGVLQLLT